MDRPVLHPFVRELADSERFRAFLEALPDTRARVSEPAFPLLLATIYEELGRPLVPLFLAAVFLERGGPLVIVFPDDAEARDAAEAAGWFLGDEHVALLPSRGVSWGSGLEPPPHLVGERARALDVLEAGGLVSASATALSRPGNPAASAIAIVQR